MDPTLGWLSVLVLCLICGYLFRMAWRTPRKFFVTFTDGTVVDTVEVTTDVPPGVHTLEIEKINTQNSGSPWKMASSRGLSFFKRSAAPRFFCLSQSFSIGIANPDTPHPKFVRSDLPLWNLNGTARDSIFLPKPIELTPGEAYAILLRTEKTMHRDIFKIERGSVYVQSLSD